MLLNLNADLGESYGAWRMGNDAALLAIVDTANVACGFHGGDPAEMARTVAAARDRGVSIGAHPSFPDLQGFGRRPMQLAPAELRATVIYQVGALQAMAVAAGTRVSHVKPHGAMNNMACEDQAMARVVAEAVAAVDASLVLLAPALSELAVAGQEAGLPVALEIFADRAYTDSGSLVPRSEPGAVLHEPAASLAHVLAMVERGGLVTRTGKLLPTRFHSVCVHGDNAEAVATAAALRRGLQAAGHVLQALPAVMTEAG